MPSLGVSSSGLERRVWCRDQVGRVMDHYGHCHCVQISEMVSRVFEFENGRGMMVVHEVFLELHVGKSGLWLVARLHHVYEYIHLDSHGGNSWILVFSGEQCDKVLIEQFGRFELFSNL